eukprot:Opistho-2@54833
MPRIFVSLRGPASTIPISLPVSHPFLVVSPISFPLVCVIVSSAPVPGAVTVSVAVIVRCSPVLEAISCTSTLAAIIHAAAVAIAAAIAAVSTIAVVLIVVSSVCACVAATGMACIAAAPVAGLTTTCRIAVVRHAASTVAVPVAQPRSVAASSPFITTIGISRTVSFAMLPAASPPIGRRDGVPATIPIATRGALSIPVVVQV